MRKLMLRSGDKAMYKENVKGAFETALERLHQIGATSLILLKLDAFRKD